MKAKTRRCSRWMSQLSECGQFATEVRMYPWHELLAHPLRNGADEAALGRAIRAQTCSPGNPPLQRLRSRITAPSGGRFSSTEAGLPFAAMGCACTVERLPTSVPP